MSRGVAITGDEVAWSSGPESGEDVLVYLSLAPLASVPLSCRHSGELDKFAGWHKASHPIQKLQRLLDCFALHSTSRKTSLYVYPVGVHALFACLSVCLTGDLSDPL